MSSSDLGQTHQDSLGQARRDVDLCLDGNRIDTDQGEGVQLGEHAINPIARADESQERDSSSSPSHRNVGRKRSPSVTVFFRTVCGSLQIDVLGIPGRIQMVIEMGHGNLELYFIVSRIRVNGRDGPCESRQSLAPVSCACNVGIALDGIVLRLANPMPEEVRLAVEGTNDLDILPQAPGVRHLAEI